MRKIKVVKLSDEEIGILSETGNIGIGHATTALSKLLGDKRVNLGLPKTTSATLQELKTMYGQGQTHSAYHKISGDMGGYAYLGLKEEDIKALVDMVSMQPVGTTTQLDENGLGVLKEVSNIIVGAYLNAVANMIGNITALPEPPATEAGSLYEQIARIVKGFDPEPESIISVQTDFDIEGMSLSGALLLIFDEVSVNLFLTKVKEKYS